MADSETELIDGIGKRLRETLPQSWSIISLRAPQPDASADAVLRLLSPSGTEAALAVEVLTTNTTRYLRLVLEKMEQVESRMPAATPMAVATYLSPLTREALRTRGYAYADATGNLYVSLEEPPVFIEATGANRNPRPQDASLQSLRGVGAARAVRALCDFTPPYGIRDLAARSGIPAPTLSRVADLLERDGLVVRERPRGPILTVDWAAAIRLWARDYSFMTKNRTTDWLEPRGLPELERKLRACGVRYALTGSLAASTLAPVAVPRLAALYVERPASFAQSMGLRRVANAGNVVLAEPYDSVVFERGFEQDGLQLTACSQIAVDLLTGPGRWPAEAEELLEWMAQNETAWRA